MIEAITEASPRHAVDEAPTHALQGLYDAWRDRDEAKIRSYFSDRDDLKLWGTDGFERIIGRAEADRAFASWIATCPPWTSIAPTHRAMHARDGMAWIADDVTGRWARDAETGSEEYRITTVWERENGAWRIVHANFASPH
jgi:hypothetical protein